MDQSSFNLHSDQLPIAQELWKQQKMRHQVYPTPEHTTETQPVCFDGLQDGLFLYDPCSAVSPWTDSNPGKTTIKQNPQESKTAKDYRPCSLSYPSPNLACSDGGDMCAFSNSDSSHQQPFGSAANVPVQMTTRPATSSVKLGVPSLERLKDQSSDWTCSTEPGAQYGFDPRSFYPSPISQESHTQFEPSPHSQMAIQIPSSPISLDAWCDHDCPTPGKGDQDHEIDHKTTLEPMPEPKKHDIPYSRLIETALRQSPDNKLSLQGIYSWFRENTLRGQDKSKGWQNSIRHNLSMNAAFIAVRENSSDGSSVWRLTSHAFEYGVESTTRYRKQTNQRKSLMSESSASRRQRSGAKDPKLTIKQTTTKSRAKANAKKDQPYQSGTGAPELVTVRQHEQEQRKQQRQRQQHGQEELSNELDHHRYIPYPTTAAPLPDMGSAVSIGGLSNVLGCAEPPLGRRVFYDMGDGSEYLSLDMEDWCEMHSTHFPPSRPSHNSGWTASEISSDLPLGI